MKKGFYIIVFIGAIVVGCKKENIQPNEPINRFCGTPSNQIEPTYDPTSEAPNPNAVGTVPGNNTSVDNSSDTIGNVITDPFKRRDERDRRHGPRHN